MITNLFSIFDPTLRSFSFSWSILFCVFIILPRFFWARGSVTSFFSSIINFIAKEISYSVPFFVKGLFSFISSIFILIFLYNFLALFPFLFCVTSHICITIPLAYSFWLGIILFSWSSSLKLFLAHLVPSGTPLGLISFMVLVELLRNIIRPLALTFRLTANIIAGHLLISLVGGFLLNLPILLFLPGVFLQSFLVLIELGVSLIQAYVFSTLLLLYLSEGLH